MNVKNIYLFSVFSFILINFDCFTGSIDMKNDSSKYKNIVLKDYGIYQFTLEIQDSSEYFDGYMLFEFYKSDSNSNHNAFDLKIRNCFWALELSDIKFEQIFLFNYPITYSIYLQSDTTYLFQRPKEYQSFFRFKRIFGEYESQARNAAINDKPFLWYSINSKIFEGSLVNFVSKDKNDTVGFYIFKCSFYTMFLKYNYYENYHGEQSKTGIFIMPISKLSNFEPVNMSLLRRKGFVKANWLPRNLFD